MQSKRDGLVPIGEVVSDLDGLVPALRDTSPQARPPLFSLALHDFGSVLAVKGSLRRFAPWTACGRPTGRN